MRFHILAVGGIGMSGIARMLLQLGHRVSGTDRERHYIVDDLIKAGLEFISLSQALSRGKVDAVVTSSAIGDDDAELRLAKRVGLPVYHRVEMLEIILRMQKIVAVTGAHGKTTSTALLSWILHYAGLNPSAYIGGILKEVNTNAWIGVGQWAVAELDESDGSFMKIKPDVVFIPTFELEHIDFYHTEEALVEKFGGYIQNNPQAKFLFGINSLLAQRSFSGLDNVLFQENLRFVPVSNKVFADLSMEAVIWDRQKEEEIVFKCPLIGEHNLRNLCGVFQVCMWLGIDLPVVISAVEQFPGVKRRMEKFSSARKDLLIIHDYAHHPTEIRAVLSSIRMAIGDRRMVVVFEPHRYSRLRGFWDEFAYSLSQADILLCTPVYSAGESKINGIESEEFVESCLQLTGQKGYAMSGYNLDELRAAVNKGDCVVFLGAGPIYRFAKDFVNALSYTEVPAKG